MEEERKGGLIHLSRTFGPEKLQRWIHLWVIMICYQKKQLSWSLFGPRINFYLIAHLSSGNPGSQSPSVWVSVSISAFRLLLLLFFLFPLLSSFSRPSPLSESHDLLISHFPEELPLSPQPLYIALVLTLSRLLPTIFRYSQRTCHYLNVSCWFMALGRPSSSPGNTDEQPRAAAYHHQLSALHQSSGRQQTGDREESVGKSHWAQARMLSVCISPHSNLSSWQ